jgi:hypothetical protein
MPCSVFLFGPLQFRQNPLRERVIGIIVHNPGFALSLASALIGRASVEAAHLATVSTADV